MAQCLNSFVMKVVSLPVYVNVAWLCAGGIPSGRRGGGEVDFWGRIGKALLWRMLWMAFSSCQYLEGL